MRFEIGGRPKFSDRKIKIDLFVTDARFALACSTYDKGGEYTFVSGGPGALALDVAVKSVSKARAKLRSRGKMLVGQVRYPWLRRVGSSPKSGFGTHERLYLETSVRGGGTIKLTLVLPSDLASRVAAEVARRAARYRLETKRLDGELRRTLESLASVTAPNAGTNAGEIYWYTLPGADYVDETSARLVSLSTRRGFEDHTLRTVTCECGKANRGDRASCWGCGAPLAAAAEVIEPVAGVTGPDAVDGLLPQNATPDRSPHDSDARGLDGFAPEAPSFGGDSSRVVVTAAGSTLGWAPCRADVVLT